MDKPRATERRAQRDFLVVNGVPFTAGIVLSCFTDVPAVPLYGKFTLGLAWGVLQCVLFVATAWLYEIRRARLADPLERPLPSDPFQTELPDAASVDGSRW